MPLLNSFVDAIVCAGFNSECGLTLDPQADANSSPLLAFLQPYVLAVLTADQAIYPQSKEIIDPSYSSTCRSKSSLELASQMKSKIPIVYNNLPLFCFPDGVKASYQQEDSRIHYSVFTQEEGKRIYAVVLTFQQKFILKSDKLDDDTYQIESLTINTTQSNIPVDTSTYSSKKSAKQIRSSFRYADTNSPTDIQSYKYVGNANKPNHDEASNPKYIIRYLNFIYLSILVDDHQTHSHLNKRLIVILKITRLRQTVFLECDHVLVQMYLLVHRLQ